MSSPKPTVKQISECFMKPKYKAEKSKPKHQPYYLSPCDLLLLSVHYNQKGLLFTKQKDFSIHKFLGSLKDSLGLTLVHFYPLAGQLDSRVDHDRHQSVVFVDCDKGPGAQFIHAQLDMTVADIISPRYVPNVVKSLFDHSNGMIVNYDGHSRPLLSVQVTELIDGIFIGCSMNHVVVDGTSFWHFWKVWSEIDRAKRVPISISNPPIHKRWIPQGCDQALPLSFTHRDEFIRGYEPSPQLTERIFHFSSESLARLKLKANEENNNNNNNNISLFQALLALVFRSMVRAIGIALDEVVECKVSANIRNRLEPRLPQEYFGNSLQSIGVTATVSELLGHGVGWAASLFHKAVVNLTDKEVRDFAKRWVESPFVIVLGKEDDFKKMRVGSSHRFEIYDIEFEGIGKPVAVRSGFANKFVGGVNAYPGYEGKGSVDLEISLLPDSMVALESDHEFMAVVSSNV